MFSDDLFIQKKIQGGDIGEFERFFVKHYKPLCLFAFRFLKDMDLSEDLVQEFFYNFWKNRQSLSLHISLKAYLYKSVRNNALHQLQHQAVMEKYRETAKNEQPMPVVEQADEIGLKELNRAIEQTLELLPERCRQVFRLSRFEGRKYQEIAVLLSVSVKTVESDMGLALKVFRKSLKEYTNTLT